MSLKQIVKTKILFLVVVFSALFAQGGSVFAAGGDWTVQSDYTVSESGVLQAQHIVSITNTDGEATPDEVKVSVFGRDIRGVSAQLQDSSALTANVDEAMQNIAISLPDQSGNGRQWSFSLNYEADVLTGLGQTQLVQIEPLSMSGSNITSHEVGVALDLGLGFAVLNGPEPDSSKVGIGSQLLTYTSETGAFKQGLTYFFGEQSSVVANFETQLENDGWWWQTKRVVLPPDTNQQRVLLESITPQPTRLALDTDGNVVAEYSLSPKRSITVSAQVTIGLRNLTYGLNSTAGLDAVDPVLRERYTPSTNFWQPANPVVEVARDIAVIEQIEGVARVIASRIDASVDQSAFNASERGGALSVADQLVGELRDRGIPARIVVGRVMSDGAELFDTPQNHAWTEAYVPGSGWITVDPSHMALSDNFGSADVLHVGFGLWGVSDDFPPVDLSGWTFVYQDEVLPDPPVIQTPVVNVTKSVIIPGISIQNMSVMMAPGQIVDGIVVENEDGAVVEYGSLAPLQEASLKSVVFGGSALSTENFQPGVIDGDQINLLGTAVSSSLSFMPMIILVGLVILVFVIFLTIRRIRSSDRYTRSKDAFIMHEEKSGSDIEQEDLVGDLENDFESAEPQSEVSYEVESASPVPNDNPVSIGQEMEVIAQAQQEAPIAQSHKGKVDEPSTPITPQKHVKPHTKRTKLVNDFGVQKPRASASSRVQARRVDDTMTPAQPRRSSRRATMVQG